MKEWFTADEIAEAGLPGLPATKRGINKLAEREAWSVRPGKSRRSTAQGGGLEYHVSLLPAPARAKLAFAAADVSESAFTDHSKLVRQRFELLSDAHKLICRERLVFLMAIDDLRRGGLSLAKALKAYQAREVEKMMDQGFRRDHAEATVREGAQTERTYHNWMSMVAAHPRDLWLAALAPSFSSAVNGVVPEFAPCHAEAWSILKSDYLRPEGPRFSACYRRMETLAKRKGWTPIPSERSLRRRLNSEVPKSAQVVAREGKRKAEEMYPAQIREKGHLRAMEITNTDGHKIDLFVEVPWKKKWTRMILLGIQDIYSGKILSHVLSESETWDAVRDCIGGMIENEGGKIPDHFYMDNGRAFASKKISGGAKARNRFKIDEDEVAGVLVSLGVTPHFTKPYSGRSKPIERAWRDLAEEISKHPAMAGAYTGNKPDAKPENYGARAVPLAKLQAHVAAVVAEHNARVGRRSPVAKGRSFNEVFAESIRDPQTIIRTATEEQRYFWLLASEKVVARKPSGQLHYQKNVYWAPELNDWIGKTLTIRFDPRKLHDPVKVYEPSGRFICAAECRQAVGFRDAAEAGRQAKAVRDLKKHKKAIIAIHTEHSAAELAEIYAEDALIAPTPIVQPVVTRLITGNLAHAAVVDDISNEEFSTLFRDGLARIAGEDASVIPFPRGNTPPPAKAGRGKSRAEK